MAGDRRGKGGKGSGGKGSGGKRSGGKRPAHKSSRSPAGKPSGAPAADARSSRPPRGRERPRGSQLATPNYPDRLPGRNLVLAALRMSGRVRSIWVDERARGGKIDALRLEAAEAGITVKDVPRAHLDEVSDGTVHNGVVGFADGLPQTTLRRVLEAAFGRQEDPLILLLDQVQYEQNLGAILRTAAAVGAHAIVIPTRRGASLTPTAQRIAMGGAEEVPVVREGMMSALATLRREGVRVVGTDAHAQHSFTELDLTGPLAIVMGGEDRGLSSSVAERCDAVARIPMVESRAVTSLNVSVSTALFLYERVRQVGLTRP
ncbi:MAG: 23S rRNA (guanosine(2251)-2'-O)-methyltransferase RlmB [Deltaproteobacteria bacterium]|nr:23S rRNA (guanosine(2251)-2'-O)-methyltransferase RlmB [Deltaproteobacteria bacterium]